MNQSAHSVKELPLSVPFVGHSIADSGGLENPPASTGQNSSASSVSQGPSALRSIRT